MDRQKDIKSDWLDIIRIMPDIRATRKQTFLNISIDKMSSFSKLFLTFLQIFLAYLKQNIFVCIHNQNFYDPYERKNTDIMTYYALLGSKCKGE